MRTWMIENSDILEKSSPNSNGSMDGLEFLSPSLITKSNTDAIDSYESFQLPPLDLGTNYFNPPEFIKRPNSFDILHMDSIHASTHYMDIDNPLHDAMNSIHDMNHSPPFLPSNIQQSDGENCDGNAPGLLSTFNDQSVSSASTSSCLTDLEYDSSTKLLTEHYSLKKRWKKNKKSNEKKRKIVDEFHTKFGNKYKRNTNSTNTFQSIDEISCGLNSSSNSSASNEQEHEIKKIGIYSPKSRRERILRFMEKRKRRVFHKQIKYDCRKRLAATCPRVKGRFVKRSSILSHPSTNKTPISPALSSSSSSTATTTTSVLSSKQSPFTLVTMKNTMGLNSEDPVENILPGEKKNYKTSLK